MPRPKTKSELIEISEENYRSLLDYIDSLSPLAQQAEFKPGTMNRNIRDVLAHLHHWHELFLHWYEVGMTGDKPMMPAEGYTWKMLPALNLTIWEKHHHTSLVQIREDLQTSFDTIQSIIAGHTDAELFEKKRYAWTGSTSLGAYLISATSSHYDWAYKLIRRASAL